MQSDTTTHLRPHISKIMVAIRDLISPPVLFAALFTALLASAVDFYPSDIDPQSLAWQYEPQTLAQQHKYEDSLATTLVKESAFANAESVFQYQAIAAEDMAISKDGTAFLGIGDGRVAFFREDEMVLRAFTRMGKKIQACGEDPELGPQCGRPLGLTFAPAAPFQQFLMRMKPEPKLFDGDEVLLVADAYRGLYLLDATGTKTVLFNKVNGKRPKFLNSVVVTNTGDVYVTESSTRFPAHKVTLDYLEGKPSGRLLHFNPKTDEVEVLARNLAFPNGLALAGDGNALLIAMGLQNKIVKYTIATKSLADFAFLPGSPDNLWVGSMNGRKLVFVGLVDRTNIVMETLKKSTTLRKLIALLPSWVPRLVITRSSVFATLDLATGDIRHVYEESSGRAHLISSVQRYGKHWYLMSWHRNALVRLPLDALKP